MTLKNVIAFSTMVFLVLSFVSDGAAQQSPIDPQLLVGKWKGTWSSTNAGGGYVASQLNGWVTLEILPGDTLKGKFALNTGQAWETPVTIEGEEVSMVYGRGMRKFKLWKGEPLKLDISYEWMWENRRAMSTSVYLEKER